MKVGIYGRVIKNKKSRDFLAALFSKLTERKIEFLLHESFYFYLDQHQLLPGECQQFNNKSLAKEPLDYIISIGGDGTMLDTLSIVRNRSIPVVGINIGRLGFLASIQTDELDLMLNELQTKAYHVDQRSILQLESDAVLFDGFPYALNDFVIHKKDSSSMITVHTYLNGEFLNSYWADGLIVSTPTGSSGYSLSCGGPLLFPGSSSFVITPIAPHNLTVRPVVISDEHVLSFEIEGRSASFLTSLDSRSNSIQPGTQLAIRRANFDFHSVRLSDQDYMSTLRNKLMWGQDNRNY